MHIKRRTDREAKPSNCRGMPQQSVQVARALIASDYANAKDRSTHTHTHTHPDADTHRAAHTHTRTPQAVAVWGRY